ncbi:MAG TPA: amidophosphoribosyltransferase [Patescibacteria group bacterium]|nr:amidophosphoribosyltransferase [Patescibacteria group bacterium]
MGDLLSFDSPNEKCAVFGAFGVPHALSVTKTALQAMQHRGQEAAGIAVKTKNGRLQWYGGAGLVKDVFADAKLLQTPGKNAIGHDRYATSGGSGGSHPQPTMENENSLSFAHNGNLALTGAMEQFLREHSVSFGGLNDSQMMGRVIAWHVNQGVSLDTAIAAAYPLFTGAFSAAALNNDMLVAFRDECGIRPLSLGKLGRGYVVASETCAFDAIGARFIRDIKPGEMVTIDATGLRSHQIIPPNPKADLFELVYFASQDSLFKGIRIGDMRVRMGEQLAREWPAAADIVVPVPNSAIPAARGFATQSNLPYIEGLHRNPQYQKRTFIEPNQAARTQGVREKLKALPVVKGKRVVLVDDSIVRGTTMVAIVQMLRDAGAREVHLRISSPPVRYPDFYGTDIPNQLELLANRMNNAQMCEHLGVDSLGYLSLEGTIAATGRPGDEFSACCFDGIYPIAIGFHYADIENIKEPVLVA